MIADIGALFLQEPNNGQRRRLAKVVNILLISYSQDKYARAIQSFAPLVEGGNHGMHNMRRHAAVDFAR